MDLEFILFFVFLQITLNWAKISEIAVGYKYKGAVNGKIHHDKTPCEYLNILLNIHISTGSLTNMITGECKTFCFVTPGCKFASWDKNLCILYSPSITVSKTFIEDPKFTTFCKDDYCK